MQNVEGISNVHWQWVAVEVLPALMGPNESGTMGIVGPWWDGGVGERAAQAKASVNGGPTAPPIALQTVSSDSGRGSNALPIAPQMATSRGWQGVGPPPRLRRSGVHRGPGVAQGPEVSWDLSFHKTHSCFGHWPRLGIAPVLEFCALGL